MAWERRNSGRRYGRAIVASSVLAGALAVVGSISPASPATVSNYTGNGISNPTASHVGPDGALWFTNSRTTRSGGSPPRGRSPTTPAPASTGPYGIAAGPDGALWFTNYGRQLDRADHHRRGGHQLHRHRINEPDGDHRRPRRGHVVHQRGQQLDRADHHHRGGHQLHRHRHRRPVGIAAGPGRGAVVHQRPATTRSGGSPPPGRSPTTPAPASTTRTASRPARRGAVVHQPRQQLDRADHHRGDGHQLHRHRHRRARTGSRPGPDGALWFTNYGNNSIGRITTAGAVTNYTGTGIDAPGGDHRRARRGLVVHQLRQQLDRADHHRRDGHQLHRARHQRARTGSRPGRTGRCGSPTTGNNSIGRITTAGTVTNYTGTGIDDPDGIAAGPDGALWFTNSATTRSGGSPPPGSSPTTPAPASTHRTGSRPGPTARCGSPTTATTRSGGSPPPGRSPSTPAPASASPTASRPGPTGRCGSPTTATTRSGGSPPPGRHQLHRHRHQRPRDHGRSRRGAVVHQRRQQLDRADHHRRGRRPTTPASGISTPDGHHGRTGRGAVVHQRRQQLDRADHHRRQGHDLHRHRDQPTRGDRRRARRRTVVHQRREQRDRADHHLVNKRCAGLHLHIDRCLEGNGLSTLDSISLIWIWSEGRSNSGVRNCQILPPPRSLRRRCTRPRSNMRRGEQLLGWPHTPTLHVDCPRLRVEVSSPGLREPLQIATLRHQRLRSVSQTNMRSH